VGIHGLAGSVLLFMVGKLSKYGVWYILSWFGSSGVYMWLSFGLFCCHLAILFILYGYLGCCYLFLIWLSMGYFVILYVAYINVVCL
jgi:hypothetical protein